MAYRLTTTNEATQKISGIPISANAGEQMRCRTVVPSGDSAERPTSFVWWIYVEDPGIDTETAFGGTYISPTTQHTGLLINRTGGGATWQLRPILKGGSLGYIYTFPSNPVGKWYMCTLTHQTFFNNFGKWVFTVFDPSTGVTTLASTGYSGTNGTTPTHAAIGNGGVYLAGGLRNAPGICLFSVIKGWWLSDGGVDADLGKTINVGSAVGVGKGLAGPMAFTTQLQSIRITSNNQLLTNPTPPTGGTFTLTFEGQTTATIAYNASAATVKSALEGLSNIDVGDIVVTGGPMNTAPVVVEFVGGLCAGSGRTLITLGTNSLTGGTLPTVRMYEDRAYGSFMGEVPHVVRITSGGDLYLNSTPPTGGTFTLTYTNGTTQTTAAIAHNAPATGAGSVQTALEALGHIGTGGVVCTGGPLNTAPVVCVFTGVQNVRSLAIGTNSLTGGTTPVPRVQIGNVQGCIFATNYAAGARGADARTGTNLVGGGDPTGTMRTVDSLAGGFGAAYHQLARGCTVVGTIPSVNPYLFGTIALAAPTDTVVGSGSSPATSLTLAASGRRGPQLTKLAQWINTGSGSGQLRVGFFANSRGVYPSQYPLRLSDGTYPGRSMATNFADMGIIGQAPLWNNSRIIGGFFPVPTCQWSGMDQLEGSYGPDCSSGLPRCLNAASSVVNPSVVLTSLVNSTLGSRLGLVSRTATTVPSSAGSPDNYRGSGCAVRLSPGCTYRIMVRPESGLPTTDPLDVVLHFINYPASSTVTGKKVVASSQSAAEDLSDVIATPGLGPSSASVPPAAKSITAVSPASLSSQVAHSSYGSITVDDTNNGFATLAAGDLMQLSNSSGISNTYNEAWVVRTVSGKGTASCVISYEWLPRQAPIVGDQVTYVKSDQILAQATASFIANEAGSGKWRGIEITAGSGGDGVALWGIEFRNPSRDGVFIVPIGRSGCGAWIQAARWPRVEDASGISLCERIFTAFDLDVVVLTTADQGTAGGAYVSSYDTLIDYVQADSPSTEIVLYSTGPEWSGENTYNKRDVGDKYDYTAAMQYSAGLANVPHTGFLFSRFTSAFNRLLTGDDTTESPTHPSCILDVTFLGQQIDGLPTSFVISAGNTTKISIGLSL